MWGRAGDRPDRLSADQKQHYPFAHHLTNEVEVEEVIKGVLKRFWKPKSDNVHWMDASYYSDVAANMKGIKLVGTRAPQEAPVSTKTLAEMAAEATNG